jgi:predicted neutral ceramidase superfamily lipid hydrolase
MSDQDESDQHEASERHETPAERSDRNWSELLQELRVAQTGVQLLTAFLLSLPFQTRFTEISAGERRLYLAVVLLAVAATGVLIAPVALHRAVFQRNAKRRLVHAAARLAELGLLLLAAAVTGVVLLIFVVVSGVPAGLAAGGTVGVLLATLWLLVPLGLRRRAERR